MDLMLQAVIGNVPLGDFQRFRRNVHRIYHGAGECVGKQYGQHPEPVQRSNAE